MDLDTFLTKYGPEWRRLEAAIAGGASALARRSGPEIDDAIAHYLRASAHLAEAQTRYRDPALVAYLSGLVARAGAAVYSVRPRTVRGFLAVFGTRYREAIRRTAPFVLIVAVLLVGIGLAADLWVATSREARVGLLPPAAREAIERATGGGRADLGIGPAAVSTVILVNNVQVAFLAFALGALLGVGTIWVVVNNAVFIGVLAGAFQAAGKSWEFWSLVLPHGILELTAICIAAGAGLRMGWSVIDPGDRPRGRALVAETRDALLVVVGVIPAFVVAALIEGFLTGTTGVPLLEIGVGVAVALGYVAFLFGVPAYSRP
ncbi:MAG: stage II sporulation protein M [Actinobacteria bacterium]|nr:stage II sporulation protein M [Actinomycetota bacterium]